MRNEIKMSYYQLSPLWLTNLFLLKDYLEINARECLHPYLCVKGKDSLKSRLIPKGYVDTHTLFLTIIRNALLLLSMYLHMEAV